MTKASDRRSFWRAVFRSPVSLGTPDGEVSAQLQDISLKGALLETAEAWNALPGSECRLALTLSPEATVAMTAEVVHVEGRHVGLRCKSIDLDSITHLRRLVELNSGESALLEREFGSLVRADS